MSEERTFKIVWREKELEKFSKCKIKEQYMSHSKEKIEHLFSIEIRPTDKRRDLKEVAEDIAAYEITKTLGSSSIHFFKVEEIKNGC